MARSTRIVAAIVGLAVAALVVRSLLPSEEARIRRQFQQLAETASVEAGETALIRAARAARLGAYFTDQAGVDLGGTYEAIQGRDAVTALAAALRLPESGLVVEILDTEVTVDAESSQAAASMTAQATTFSSAGEEQFDAREFVVRLRKVDGEWLIDEMRAVGRPPG